MNALTGGPLTVMTSNFDTVLWNDSADPEELSTSISWGGVGATCNPVIAYTGIKKNIAKWGPRIQEIANEHKAWSESEIGWQVVKEMSVEAAKLLEPAFRESKGRNGRLSVQTDPRLSRSTDALVEQAVEFSKLAENIIVKVPATSVGIPAIEEATYRGVVMNVTVSFTVPQVMAAAEAIERGLKRREEEGLSIEGMHPVVTLMGGRLDDWLKDWVKANDIVLDPGVLEWAGVAAMKRAYHLMKERGLRSRLLSAAFRNHMQWSELIGGDLVVSPPFKFQAQFAKSDIEAVSRIAEPVDERIMETLRTLSEFNRAYEEDGMTVEEFDTFGATRKTLRQFYKADEDLDTLVRDILIPAP
ncbi:transaldolase family protein [Helcobacillus massiliensis]|uniref:Transaldolase n=1 Tax=Helcobacillus massiliensis TaxID=521392 RepID=A0A839QTD1_9MICO|nr:transaldolase family protein [Helcobacillus massiliensis]MBB3023564.1 transaldolase [Helcobacillus massiliensis]MCT1557569.1 transaldolase family protein [Helcobacillus massiliensis]MCT2036794.1 transaldolase family protein [Helcobacillus massiliensis]MCT2332453.1 transaldolase family protein [Helcobacillus massiliensis]